MINTHDVMVHNEYRGIGLCQRILKRVEDMTRGRGCCKITLEVLKGNKTAQAVYQKLGYAGYVLDPIHGESLFWQKPIKPFNAVSLKPWN